MDSKTIVQIHNGLVIFWDDFPCVIRFFSTCVKLSQRISACKVDDRSPKYIDEFL